MNRHTWQRLLYSLATLVVIAGVTYACKDFLNQPAQGTVDQATLATKVGVEGSLIAAYRALDCSSSSAGSWGCAASNWVWGSVVGGDAYKGSDLGDQQPINDIETFLWSVGEADGYLNQKWSQVYEGVARANASIRLLEAVEASNPGQFAAGEARQIKGEALFLRAHYHFEAYRMWGHIPYYKETDTDLRKPNDLPLDSIVKLIIADLDSAAAMLPVLLPRNNEKGRVTSWAAQAYKGRVQVYAAALNPAYWAQAITTLTAVKNSNHFALETSFDHVWTAFPAYRNGKETILAFQASVKDGEPSGWNSNWGERLNFPYAPSHFACCGFHQPSYNLVNYFKVDAAGLPLALAGPAWNTDTTYAGMAAPLDPRLDWTVGRDNVPYKDWSVHIRQWIRDASYSGPYSPKKNIHEQGAPNAENNVGWVASQTNDVPIHIYRYADMLLLLAEAEVEAGNLENARAIVNSIRARAGIAAQGCGSADTTVTNRYPSCVGNTRLVDTLRANLAGTLDSLQSPWAFYKIGIYTTPWTVQATARAAVRAERRLELAMEGQHFFDLRRWGGSDTVITNYINSEKTRIQYLSLATPYVLPQYLYYPIPSVQVELSKVGSECKLVQNTGWGTCN
jgi:starch-binding outer membrane protein, SusD/RagB family